MLEWWWRRRRRMVPKKKERRAPRWWCVRVAVSRCRDTSALPVLSDLAAFLASEPTSWRPHALGNGTGHPSSLSLRLTTPASCQVQFSSSPNHVFYIIWIPLLMFPEILPACHYVVVANFCVICSKIPHKGLKFHGVHPLCMIVFFVCAREVFVLVALSL